MSTKYAELKNECKRLAAEIRIAKEQLKKYQRKHGGNDGGHYAECEELAWHYRHKHIAYCILRGTPRDKIEQPREGNEPNETLIQEFINEYSTEDVRSCA